MIIAIDGPAGSGKSSVAKALAERLGFRYLDTGAMYRAVAYRALTHGLAFTDEPSIAAIAEDEPIAFGHEGQEVSPSRVSIGGEDVTEAIRTPAVDDAVSPVSALPLVREAMVAQQRRIASADDVVVEGRDIGTVVFPDAELKVYLTASARERAKRRALQHREAGLPGDADVVLDALIRRDKIDSSRAHSPLAAAPDAVLVDTTDLTFEEVVERIAALVRGRRE